MTSGSSETSCTNFSSLISVLSCPSNLHVFVKWASKFSRSPLPENSTRIRVNYHPSHLLKKYDITLVLRQEAVFSVKNPQELFCVEVSGEFWRQLLWAQKGSVNLCLNPHILVNMTWSGNYMKRNICIWAENTDVTRCIQKVNLQCTNLTSSIEVSKFCLEIKN